MKTKYLNTSHAVSLCSCFSHSEIGLDCSISRKKGFDREMPLRDCLEQYVRDGRDDPIDPEPLNSIKKNDISIKIY